MAVRSKRFFGPTIFGLGTTLAYTVPFDRTARVASVFIYNISGAARTVALELDPAGAGGSVTFWAALINNAAPVTIIADQIWEPGDVINVTVGGGASDVRVTAWGSLLLGAPE